MISHVQSNVSSVNPGTSLAVSLLGVAQGALLVLGVVTGGAGTTVTSVSDGVNTWQRVAARLFLAGASGTEIWAAYNVAAGDVTVTVNFSASVGAGLHLHEVAGCVSGDAFDKEAGATGNSATPDSGNTPATTVNDEYLFGFISHAVARVLSEATGYTTRQSQSAVGKTSTADRVVTVAGAYKYDPTLDAAGVWNARIATFKGAERHQTRHLRQSAGFR